MPRIRRERIPEALMAHLVRRVREREISTAQLGLFARWLDADPDVSEGDKAEVDLQSQFVGDACSVQR